MWDLNLVSAAAADVLASHGVRPSTHSVLATLGFSSQFLSVSKIQFCWYSCWYTGTHGKWLICDYILWDALIHWSPVICAYGSELGQHRIRQMARQLFCTKPSPEPMLANCLLGLYQWSFVNFESKYKHLPPRKCMWICPLQRGVYFVKDSWCLKNFVVVPGFLTRCPPSHLFTAGWPAEFSPYSIVDRWRCSFGVIGFRLCEGRTFPAYFIGLSHPSHGINVSFVKVHDTHLICWHNEAWTKCGFFFVK